MEPESDLDGDTRSTQSRYRTSLAEAQVPTLTILAHPDRRRIGDLATLPELSAGRPVRLSRIEPALTPVGSAAGEPLADRHLSRTPIVLAPGGEDGAVTIERGRGGPAVAVDGEPLGERRCLGADDLERGVVIELAHRIVLLLHRHYPITVRVPHHGLVGESTAIVRLRQEIGLVARLDAAVLLYGESGTGKELVARAIHDAGLRREGPYVAVNVAAIPASLAAAELFGALKGSYTGADRSREGFFVRADGGTLFLDEIGGTPPEVQPLLLRALESGEIQPVGSEKTRRVSVRVIAATDADLAALVAAGGFRAPLLHRLAAYQVRVPPLRERRSDFGRLLDYFLQQELAAVEAAGLPAAAPVPWPPAEVVARLARQSWPGNVRQLRNAARQLAIASRAGGEAALATLLASLDDGPAAVPVPRPAASDPWQISDEELLAALRAHRFELKPTAAALGISRSTLYKIVARSPRIRKAGDLERAEIEAAVDTSGRDLTAAAEVLEVSRQGLKRRMKVLGMR